MKELRVLSVASEAYPFVKTGGLGDVVGALPAALAREGVVVRTLIPGYPTVTDALSGAATVHTFPHLQGGPAHLLAAGKGGFDLYVLDAPHLYARPGNPYVGPDGKEWPDNALRFAALGECATAIARGIVPGYVPHVVQAHDWQAGLAPTYLHYSGRPRPATVITIHNLAYQGHYPRSLLTTLGLPPHAFSIDGVEYHGGIGFLKAALALADRITTVSPTYAIEIQTPEGGMGLDGLLRKRADQLTGILNGIDDKVWDPMTDLHLPARYDAKQRAGRALNKAALQRRFGLDIEPETLLFGVVSRLTWQKGLDLLLEALPALERTRAQLALVGTGDKPLEEAFLAAARARPGRIGAIIGHDEALAHLMQGGADALLVPSRYEPCGLTQLCALRYGAIPVVAHVGGLADTVVDANDMALAAGAGTGVQFMPVTPDGLQFAIMRSAALWRDRNVWRRIQSRAMATDVTWTRPAIRYAKLFRELVATSGA